MEYQLLCAYFGYGNLTFPSMFPLKKGEGKSIHESPHFLTEEKANPSYIPLRHPQYHSPSL
jgi:hypothetical protein